MDITYHIASEHERSQTRLGLWFLMDVSATVASNQTREAYGSTERSIVLTIPKKDHSKG